MHSSLELFSAPVVRWFRNSFGAPTAPQEEGWPHIARSENTLILAPTGSGKTLAAFLWMIDDLATRSPEPTSRGVRAIYVSPLRALAADVERNLAAPLRGIRACGEEMGIPVAEVRVGVRTGDTSPADRQRMLRCPPDLLITTPESLHLLLTARRSREMLRDVRHVIVDEIHTVCGEKRGTFLALVLERLEHLAARPVVRIGLSATQRPLERVARFLGGYDSEGKPRPVAIVDCGGRKDIDLAVIAPVPDMRLLPQADGQAPSVWPGIYDRLLELTRAHTTTLIFANNRRAVERIAAEMNRRAGRRLVRAHHGSVAKEYRQEIEGELKAGRLPALVATASLELGLDIGDVDLVCQLGSPRSIATFLQRAGRAGHVAHRVSVGRMIPKTRSDLLRMACMSRAMLRGDISAVRVPENPLDVLAQQVIAIVATGDWLAEDLYRCVRRADPFHDLPRSSFDAVLEMVSGEYQTPAFPGLRARILWEKGAGRLSALPGALHAAISAGGTIPDTGQYAMVLEDGKTRLGELDEEFVFERRVGDTFVLGTGRWRILDIRHDRVVVSPSAMEEAQLPFWKGEGLGHDAEFGERLGAFVAECRGRSREGDLALWLERECALDPDAARILAEFVAEQAASGGLPDDRTVLVDVFPNETGDLRASIVSTFGRSFHLALWLALRAELRRAGREPLEGIVSNDGILLRLGSLLPSDLIGALESLRDGRIRDRLLEELRDSPYFALRFRRNAGRALLLPRSHPGKRMPLWLQRLRSHDLLSYASEHARFPIVLETYREILDDVLPVATLETFARRLANGEARLLEHRSPTPSPLSAALLLDFLGKYMYEVDRPAAQPARVDNRLLDDLLGQEGAADRVSDDAIRTMEERLQCLSAFHRARTAAEAVALLCRLGDLTRDELLARCEPEAAAAIPELEREGRIRRIAPPLLGEERLVAADAALDYAGEPADEERVLVRFLSTHAGRTEEEVRRRYPGATVALDTILARGAIVRVDLPGKSDALLDCDVLAGLRRMTLGERRRVASPVSGAALAAAVLRRQHVTGGLAGIDGLRGVLEELAGWLAPVAVWPEILDARLTDAGRPRLEALVRGGVVEWRGARRGGTRLLGFAPAGAAIDLLPRPAEEPGGLAGEILAYLSTCGASFLHQISLGLDRAPAAIDEVLWDLTWCGWVTNDSLVAALRPGPGRARPTPAVGRWSRVRAEEAADPAEREAVRLRVLLHRFGFLSREVLDHDTMGLRWSDAYPVLSRMEWRGDVERGIFVSGLSGPQFAAPGMDADMRLAPDGGGPRLLCAMDPACVFFGADADRMPRKAPGSYVVVRNGRPLLSIEASAGRLTPLADLASDERRAALALVPNLVRRAGQRPSVRFGWWGEASIVDSEAAADLAALGFLRDDRSMILYRSFGGAR